MTIHSSGRTALLATAAWILLALLVLGWNLDAAGIAMPYSDPPAHIRAQDETIHIDASMRMAREAGVPLDLAQRVNSIFEKGKESYGGGAWSTQIVKLLEDAVGKELRAPGFPARLEA